MEELEQRIIIIFVALRSLEGEGGRVVVKFFPSRFEQVPGYKQRKIVGTREAEKSRERQREWERER